MKKCSLFSASLLFVLLLGACSTATTNQRESSSLESANVTRNDGFTDSSTLKKSSLTFPAAELGRGTIALSNTKESTADGKKIIIYVSQDTMATQIGLDTINFDEARLSYIYIDSSLNTKQTLGDSQIELNLQDAALKPGKHQVQVVQFANDQETGKIINYKILPYTIETK